MEVVEQQGERTFSRDGLEESRYRPKKALLLFLTFGEVELAGYGLSRKQPLHLRPPLRDGLADGFRSKGVECGQRLQEWEEGDRCLRFITPASGHDEAVVTRLQRHLLSQARLADAGFAGEQDQPARAALHCLNGIENPVEFFVPGHEHALGQRAEEAADGQGSLVVAHVMTVPVSISICMD